MGCTVHFVDVAAKGSLRLRHVPLGERLRRQAQKCPRAYAGVQVLTAVVNGSQEMALQLSALLAKYGLTDADRPQELIPSLFAGVTDGAGVERKTIQTELRREWLWCAAHLLQCTVKAALGIGPAAAERAAAHDDLLGTMTIMRKLKRIWKAFHDAQGSRAAKSVLKTNIRRHHPQSSAAVLTVPIDTRWGSYLACLRRLLSLQTAVAATLAEVVDLRPLALTADEWVGVRKLVAILAPVEKATTDLSGVHYVTSSLGIPVMRALSSDLTSLMALEVAGSWSYRLIQWILQDIQRRWGEVQGGEVLYLAYMLDPRFKGYSLSVDELAYANEKLRQRAEEEAKRLNVFRDARAPAAARGPQPAAPAGGAQPPPAGIAGFFAGLADEAPALPAGPALAVWDAELDTYRALKRQPLLYTSSGPRVFLPMSEQPDPLEWWAARRETLPVLFSLAMKYLAVPLTSVAAERLFSVTGDLTGKKRATVAPALLHAEVVLRHPLTRDDDMLPATCACPACQRYRERLQDHGDAEFTFAAVDSPDGVARDRASRGALDDAFRRAAAAAPEPEPLEEVEEQDDEGPQRVAALVDAEVDALFAGDDDDDAL